MMTAAPQTDVERAARRLTERLAANGARALFAGGAVRDRLLGRTPKDVDVVTSATPEQVIALFPRTKTVGKSFGVVLVESEGHWFEVATFRREREYADGRRPSVVEYGTEAEDAARRDFTINGLFYDPARDDVLDYVGGRADLAAGVIRAIGDPDERFAEDHLRLLRAVRFAAQLEFTIEPRTHAAIRAHAAALARISAERVQQELTRILTEPPRPGQAVRLLRETGLLAVVLPDVDALAGVEQPPEFHPEGDVLTHTVLMLDGMTERAPELAWAALLHDIGKPPTARRGPDRRGGVRWRFDSHDRIGAEMARAILTRLRMPNKLIENVSALIRDHMRFMEVPHMRPATLRRMLADPLFPLARELHRLDCLASHGDASNLDRLDAEQARRNNETALPTPLLDGHALAALGVPAGPEMGEWKRRAYERQLDDPALTREALAAWVTDSRRAAGAT